MVRVRCLPLPLLFAAVPPAFAQGVVNESLLRAPDDDAATAALRRSGPSAVFEGVQRSVVYVAVEVAGPQGKFVFERSSSGVVVDAEGLVLTWHHLVREVEGAADKRLFVQLNDASNTRLDAAIAHVDPASGLALLRVTPPADGLVAAALGPDRPQWGEPVVVVARPKGEEMLAFAGVASAALAPVTLEGRPFAADEVFLSDARNDERCDGASVFGRDGVLLGLYASEHVQRDIIEPTLADLQRPSFGVIVPAGRARAAFAAQFAGSANASLRAAPDRPQSPWAAAVAHVAPAVVAVRSGGGDWPVLPPDDPGAVQRRAALGSGVVLTAGGLAVTNLNIAADRDVASAGQVRVRTRDGRVFPAKVIARNVPSNLALLQIELPAGTVLSPADCGADDGEVLGETVLAVGNPLGTQVVVSAGIVSAIRAREGGRIQADANLGNQNGGGAVVDVTGRLLGIGDAGLIDPIEMAFRTRGDRATQESNLSTFVGIRRVRELFGEHFAGADATIATPRPASAAELAARRNEVTAMVERASGAMLNIYVARNVAKVDPNDPFAAQKPAALMPLSLGSGVVIDQSGLAISNWHVVEDATRPDGSADPDYVVTARVFGGKQYRVRVLSISREDDLSLLQLELEPGETVQGVAFGDSDALRIGESVAAIGNPHGRANTITYGVVSAKEQELRVRGRWAKLEHLIETDAAINGGNSGGALLDMAGRLVGINSAGGGTFNNKGYAIAVDHVRRQLLGLLLQPYKLRSPELGLRVIDEDGKVLVMDVDERGPAARTGVRSGDRVVALGGTAITWSPGFARTLLQQEPGVDVELRLERGGQPVSITLAPLAAEVWSLIRQSGLQCRDLEFAASPDRIRAAEAALAKEWWTDPAPVPEQVVIVDRICRRYREDQPVEPGDLLLAVELPASSPGTTLRRRITSVAMLRDLFNDQELSAYEQAGGHVWTVWLERGGAVRAVELYSHRLFW